jgi:ATP/maltotriose-dependent transcriptional regulator MalT
MVHAHAGRRFEMEEAAADALAIGEDRDDVEVTVWSATGVFHVVDGDLWAAVEALDRAMEALRRSPAAMRPFPGLWALVRTVLDDGGREARAEVAALRFDDPFSRATLAAAEAVSFGRSGRKREAEDRFTFADAALGRSSAPFRRCVVRLLVAPVAHGDGWGDAVGWLREALAVTEALGIDWCAARCRADLRQLGAAVPRRGRGHSPAVPPSLARLGITSREVDVLGLVAAGLTNREVAQTLFISTRTVDKHVERLIQKTRVTRRELAGVARDACLLRT